MSDAEDGSLFDEDFEAGGVLEDPFAGDDGEAEGLLDEDVELGPPEEAAPAPEPTSGASERRKALLQLAQRKAREGGDGEAGPKKKKQKGDKQERGSSRPQRSRRQRAGSEDREDRQHAAAANLPEIDENAIEETDADRNFIDDEGLAEDERYIEDEEAIAHAEEAEEAAAGEEDEAEPTSILDEVLKRRKRKKKDDSEVDQEVLSLVSMMTACAEKDNAAMEARPPQPAINKLKALANVGETLRQRRYHEAFVASKGLHAMAMWLQPYKNGTLPNAKVRGELVELLGVLQLDTTNDYIRERLEESELGKIIMFYFKNPNEGMLLRSKCRDLIQEWSAPIFADQDEELRKRRQRERAHRQRQAAEKAERERQEQLELEIAQKQRTLRPTDKGFRSRAAVPQPSKMDFVINPGSKMDPLEASLKGGAAGGSSSGAGGPKAKQSPIGGRLGKVLQQKKRGARDRMGGVSVEGRGIQL